jgi:predicted metalloprotease
MRWEGRQQSQNVEDRRGFGRRAGIAVGGGSVLLLLLSMVLGVDLRQFVDLGGKGQPGPAAQQAPVNPEEEHLADFSKTIFNDTEIVWDEQFRRLGRSYQKPVLVLFSGQVQSACGTADTAVGPFYCPGDSRVYIDLSFYRDMQRKLNAPGDFARAYVLAHEVGHHVQRLLGYSKQVEEARLGASRAQANQMSVRLELQADFLAGVWAHHAQEKFKYLDPGDVEEALNAAFQIGDDRLQKRAQGYVVPDAFTHGTSKQRARWFKQGFEAGDVKQAALLFTLPYNEL